MAEWWWDEGREQYYDDEEDRWLEWAIVFGWLLTRIGRSIPKVNQLALLLVAKEISLSAWEARMRALLTSNYIQAYILARGGLPQMTASDWALLSEMLDGQFDHLSEFAQAILEGGLSEAQIGWRSRLYMESVKQAYWRAYGEAHGWPLLPAYPGDCSTRCCTNCLCYWEGERVNGAWHFYWRLRPAEHCVDCVARAQEWNPLRIAA